MTPRGGNNGLSSSETSGGRTALDRSPKSALGVLVDTSLTVEGIKDRKALVLLKSEYVMGVSPKDCANYRCGDQIKSLAFRESKAPRSRCLGPSSGMGGCV